MISKDPIVIVPKNTYSKSAYAKKFNVSRQWLDQLISKGQVEVIEVNGVKLLVAEKKK